MKVEIRKKRTHEKNSEYKTSEVLFFQSIEYSVFLQRILPLSPTTQTKEIMSQPSNLTVYPLPR
jgi:hypothetical protein